MRYFVGFLITIGLLILLIVLLLTGGGGKKSPKTTGDKPRTTTELAAYADTDAVVRWTADGQINANSLHTSLQVTVGREEVVYEQMTGYQGQVVKRQVYNNNQDAYSSFLYAIGRAGFTLGKTDSNLANENGYCSLGRRYVFELREGDHDIQRYWATSCGGGAKTYEGNLPLTLQLFQLQVPDYTDLTNNLENF